MGKRDQIKTIVIVGGGPVGNFAAVLSRIYGINTYVYQKRSDYTREINVKIQEGFFKDVGQLFDKIFNHQDSFFEDLNTALSDKKFRIKLHVLEKKLKDKAELLGAVYRQRDIKDFQQAYNLHQKDYPLVLDCAGRRSPIRINQFGSDEQNMEISGLQSAMNINFKAKLNNMGYLALFQLIYPVFKSNPLIKIGEIVVNKNVDQFGYSHVTIPLAIEKQLAQEFDKHFPDINRHPWKPFTYTQNPLNVPETLQMAVSSVFYPLVLQDWKIDWGSVTVKKIQITCGYSRVRSQGKLICLGDSAAHFAYFKSLNIGLQHTAKLFQMFLNYPHIKKNQPPFENQTVLSSLQKQYPLHVWHSVYASKIPNYALAITKPLLYGCFTINLVNMKKNLVNFVPSISLQSAQNLLKIYQVQKMKRYTLFNFLNEYESWRQGQIKRMVSSNQSTNQKMNFLSKIIRFNSIFPLKISQTFMYVRKGYFLNADDFIRFHKTLQGMKNLINDRQNFVEFLQNKMREIQNFYDDEKLPENLIRFMDQVDQLFNSQYFRWSDIIGAFRELNWRRDQFEFKMATSVIKSIDISLKMVEQNNRQKRLQRRNLSKDRIRSPQKIKRVKKSE